MDSSDIVIVDYDVTCGAGVGLQAVRQSLQERRTGLCRNDLPHSDLPTWIGKVAELDDFVWPESEKLWQSRNNALISLALSQGSIGGTVERLKRQFGSARVGLVVGSSTSSIDRSECAYRHFDVEKGFAPEFHQENVLNPHAPSFYINHLLDIQGPTITINTACSSSAKVFASAERWLRVGVVDAVLVVGADSLGLSVLHGFHSLQLVSANPCKPFDQNRDGINLGEAAGFAVLVRASNTDDHCGVKLSGYGESSDAHHMSHPHPEGKGARLAMEQALARANLSASDIGYINLHGTASRVNDEIEGRLVASLFPETTIKSSTKGWTGHTLGAAGILESVIAIDALRTQLMPGTLNMDDPDSEFGSAMSQENITAPIVHSMTNSFGFGGNNASLVFSGTA